MNRATKMNLSLRLLIGSFLYQAVWFATVLSAGHPGRWWWGVLTLLGFMGVVHLGWPSLRPRVWWMLVAAVGCGFVLDTGMIAGRIWHSPRLLMPAPFPPLWLLLLWAAFGIYIALSLEMLYGRYRLAALVGAIGGMLAYRGGALLGAIQWGKPEWMTTSILMLVWALAFPALVWIATKIREQEMTAQVRTTRMHVALM